MQNPAIYIFSLKERSNIIVEDEKHTKTDRTQNFNIIIEPVVARSTPVNRKFNLWMDLGDISCLSTVDSQANGQRNNFNELLKYWDGEGGQDLHLKDEPQKPNQRSAEPKLDTASAKVLLVRWVIS